MKPHIVKNKFKIRNKNNELNIVPFDVIHGLIKATGFVFNKVAYISDCNAIPKKSMKHLYNLNVLVLDCLKISKHPSHFSLDEALDLIKIVKPKKTILTNLHTDLDYHSLKKELPTNIIPAYDGINFNF